MEPARDQCAYYFAKEQIENLQIRVTLQQLSGSQLVAASPRVLEGELGGGGRGEDFPLMSLPTSTDPDHLPHQTTSSHTQHVVIKWQQKLLSACETVEYSRPVYADDPQHRSMHQQALKQKKRKKRKQRIFTYQHHDNYQFQNWQKASTSKKLEPENWLRQRRNVARNVGEASTTLENHATHTANKRKKKKKEKSEEEELPDLQYFYIMADLAPAENLGESRVYEVVLCELRYSTQGQLTVSPDFTKPGAKPYRLESYGSDNALYEYKLENVSPSRSAEEKQQEDQLVMQLARQRIEEVQKLSACEWDESGLRGEDELRVVVMGEITRALNFDQADYLYIHYTLHLPSGWRSNIESECEGLTPACALSYIDDIPTAHYSTPFTFDFTRLQSGTGWPVLLLGAFSVDWLGRDRDEGYASFTLTGQEDSGSGGGG